MTTPNTAPLPTTDFQIIAPNPSAIPDELKQLPQLVVWRKEARDGKATKVPYCPFNTDIRAKADDPQTWGTFAQAWKAYEAGWADGIGFEFTAPYFGIDLDHCRDAQSGTIELWAREIIDLMNTYTEVSISGTGIHMIGRGTLPPGGRRKGQIEVYQEGRYFTVSGRLVDGTPAVIRDCQSELAAFHQKYIAATPVPSQTTNRMPPQGDGSDLPLNDSEILDAISKSKNNERFKSLWEGGGDNGDASAGDQSLCNMLAFWTGKDAGQMDRLFRRSGRYRDKWNKKHFGDGRTYGEATLQKAIDSCAEVYRGQRKEKVSRSSKSPMGSEEFRPARPDDLPMLVLPGSGQTITSCAEQLFDGLAKTEQFFRRGGRLVMINIQDGQTVLVNVTPEMLRSIPEKSFSVFAIRMDSNGDKVYKPTVMSREAASAILECDARAVLPEIRGLSACPLMLHDGRIIGKGFDPGSGIFVTGDQKPELVPLKDAVEGLRLILADFDFMSSGDKSRGLAGLITPALRLGRFFRRSPMQIIEADQSQTGKDYLTEVVSAIYNEHPQLVTVRQGGVGSFDESLGSRLVAGHPFIVLGNLRDKIDSQQLEAFQTCESSFWVRVPHRGDMPVDPQGFNLLATSNAAETTTDLANRSYIVRLRKRPLGYRFHRYPEGDLLDHIRQNQPYYLGCVFAVLRAWIEAGRPQTEEARHDFREWARTLDWIIQNVFKAAPLMDGHEDAKARISDPSLSFVRVLAVTVDQAGHLGEGRSASDLYELAEANGVNIPGLREPDERQGPRAVGKILGRFMENRDVAVVDDYRICIEVRRVPRPDGTGYFDMKFYRFEHLAPTSPDGRTAVDAVDAVEGIYPVKNTGIFKEVIGSTAVNCDCGKDNKDNAREFVARMAERGVVIRLDDGDRVTVLGVPTDDERTELARLNEEIKVLLKEAASELPY